jgi:hypothetical protein
MGFLAGAISGFLSTAAVRDVAALYSVLGYEVQQSIVLVGQQVDLLLQRNTGRDSKVRMAVEVKSGYHSPITPAAVDYFSAVAKVLKNEDAIDAAAMVSSSGFTTEAKRCADEAGIVTVDLRDLRKKARDRIDEYEKAMKGLERLERARREGADVFKRKIFVLMPFSEKFTDIYAYGILKVAGDLGHVAQRADDIEHNEDAMRVVKDRIQEADAIVADISDRNPNVFYEVGYAHACNRPVILICRKGAKVPFDLQSYNYIQYKTIRELEQQLHDRLKATLGEFKRTSAAKASGLL